MNTIQPKAMYNALMRMTPATQSATSAPDQVTLGASPLPDAQRSPVLLPEAQRSPVLLPEAQRSPVLRPQSKALSGRSTSARAQSVAQALSTNMLPSPAALAARYFAPDEFARLNSGFYHDPQ